MIDPNKIYEFNFSRYDRRTTRTFHTSFLSDMIYNFILKNGSKSYLELGSGFGGIMLRAADALEQVSGNDYTMTGVDVKKHRNNYARQLLREFGVNGDIIEMDANRFELKNNVDILFIDCGYQANQKMLDRFGGMVNQAIFVHDVQENNDYIIPGGFQCKYIKKHKMAIISKI